MTIYQIIFQPENNEISVRRTFADNASWVDIDLDDFYIEVAGQSDLID